MIVVRSASASDVGRVRESNEDLALETPSLFAVADGMGGHVGGAVAARVAVDALQQTFARQPSAEGLLEAVIAANNAVWSQSQQERSLRGMGTTLTTAALVRGGDGRDVIALANVGDSRAYILVDARLTQVTADHSLAEERVRQGVMTEAEAAVHPHRHILTRALGIGPGVDVDLWELRLKSGDRLLLCSDGLTNELSDDQIAGLLTSHRDPEEACRSLIAEANRQGGNDNITVVVVDVLIGEDDGYDDANRETRAVALPVEGDGKGAAAGASGPPASGPPASGPPASGPPNGTDPRTRGGGTEVVAGTERPAGVVVLPAGAAPKAASEGRHRRKHRRMQPRALTLRVALFVLLLAGVVVAAYFVVRWYATDAYYVGVDHRELVIYQGHPGGILWFEPRAVDKTGVRTSEVLAVRLPALRGDISEPTLGDAKRYVENLRQEAIAQRQIANGTVPTAPTTVPSSPTVPPATAAPAHEPAAVGDPA